jgi:nitrous oxide reductase accessory protein NosL
MRHGVLVSALLVPAVLLVACGEPSADGPPSVRLGESLCDHCNMSISDGRWATATVVEGPRGPEARLFDDFNCQVNYENKHPDIKVLARWSHSHPGNEWMNTQNGRFLLSPNLRTPMGSKVAMFESASAAEAAQRELTGDVLTFEAAWQRLGFTGHLHATGPSATVEPGTE